jgi:hypothetical protein
MMLFISSPLGRKGTLWELYRDNYGKDSEPRPGVAYRAFLDPAWRLRRRLGGPGDLAAGAPEVGRRPD